MVDDELVMMLSPCENVAPVGQIVRHHWQTVPEREKTIKVLKVQNVGSTPFLILVEQLSDTISRQFLKE